MGIVKKADGEVERVNYFDSLEQGVKAQCQKRLNAIIEGMFASNYPKQYDFMTQASLQEAEWHIKKNNDYGAANITGFGLDGIVVRLWDKMCRIMNLMGYKIVEIKVEKTGAKSPSNESLEDSFLDMSIYSRIARCIIHNKWGK